MQHEARATLALTWCVYKWDKIKQHTSERCVHQKQGTPMWQGQGMPSSSRPPGYSRKQAIIPPR